MDVKVVTMIVTIVTTITMTMTKVGITIIMMKIVWMRRQGHKLCALHFFYLQLPDSFSESLCRSDGWPRRKGVNDVATGHVWDTRKKQLTRSSSGLDPLLSRRSAPTG